MFGRWDDRRHQEGWHSPCGWMWLLRGQLQRAASRGRAARPAPASAEVCGDDGNMEVEEMETSQQQHLILVIQVCAGFSAVWPARGSVMWQEEYMIWCWLVAPIHYLTTEWISDQARNQLITVLMWCDWDQQRQQEGGAVMSMHYKRDPLVRILCFCCQSWTL